MDPRPKAPLFLRVISVCIWVALILPLTILLPGAGFLILAGPIFLAVIFALAFVYIVLYLVARHSGRYPEWSSYEGTTAKKYHASSYFVLAIFIIAMTVVVWQFNASSKEAQMISASPGFNP
jgi:hypothetical protein